MLKIVRGTTKRLQVTTINKVTGDIFPLTDYQAKITIKGNPQDTTPQLEAVVENIENPELGIVIIELTPALTENLKVQTSYWEVFISKPDNSEAHVIDSGQVEVKQKLSN